MHTNCTNCGATLSLDRFKHRLTCSYCDTVHTASLRDDADVRKLEGIPSATNCPVCDSTLQHAKLRRWQFLYCPRCHGLLLDSETFLNIVLYRRRGSGESYEDPKPIDPGDLDRKVACPDCGNTMSAHPYYGPGNFIIDSCHACDNVWLDGGELDQTTRAKWGGSLWQ